MLKRIAIRLEPKWVPTSTVRQTANLTKPGANPLRRKREEKERQNKGGARQSPDQANRRRGQDKAAAGGKGQREISKDALRKPTNHYMPGYGQGASHSTALQMQTTSTHYRSGVWKTITPKMKSKLVIRDVMTEDG